MESTEISQEHFISEHVFVYVGKGIMNLYDGNEYHSLSAGQCRIARKNRLGRISTIKQDGALEKMFIPLEERFLRMFQERHRITAAAFKSPDTFIKVNPGPLLPHFIRSLQPYYSHGKLSEAFADIKCEELLTILLQNQPELSGVFFDYGIPQKLNIEEFMSQNFKFNVSLERFAFLTGRSLSAFKRDFKAVFNDTPGC